jgi:hypothetical protein
VLSNVNYSRVPAMKDHSGALEDNSETIGIILEHGGSFWRVRDQYGAVEDYSGALERHPGCVKVLSGAFKDRPDP